MKLLVICIFVMSAATAQAESLAEKHLRILNNIIKLIEERRQLDVEIDSMWETMEDEVNIASEMGLTQEEAKLLAKCNNDPLWRRLKANGKKLKKIKQRLKKIGDEVERYNAKHLLLPLPLLNKWKRYNIYDLKTLRKRHAMVKKYQRKCRITNEM